MEIIMNEKIGIVGMGFVGNAIYEGMKHAFEILTYDKQHERCNTDSLKSLLSTVMGPIFIALPTPMKRDGTCDLSTIENVLNTLDRSIEDNDNRIIIIKSTVPPGTTAKFNQCYKNFTCVFNPEFLRESNFIEDFKNQDRIIIGGPHRATTIVKQMYQRAYPEVPTTKTSSTIAELVKYTTNCFLSVKVSFANELYQICEKLEVDFDKVIEYSTKDKRLGTSHWAVPGPDGHFGFGLTCFPKDLNALILLAETVGVDPKVMKAAWKKNLEVRPERDWEKLRDRAVS